MKESIKAVLELIGLSILFIAGYFVFLFLLALGLYILLYIIILLFKQEIILVILLLKTAIKWILEAFRCIGISF